MLKSFLFILFFITAINVSAVIDVAVGIAPEKYIVEQIGGDKVNVFCVLPEGKNMHDFSVTPEMVRKVASSRVFIHVNLLFEQQLAKLVSPRKTEVVNLSIYVPRIMDQHFLKPHRHDHNDVHIWFSYNSLYRMVVETEKILSEIDGKNAAYYFKNRVDLCRKIENARHAAEKKLRKCKQRVFITYHAAFGYYAVEFNLHQQSFWYNGDITPKNLAEAAKAVKKHHIKRIFIQSHVSEKVRNALQNATKCKLVVIDPDSYDVLATLNKFTDELEVALAK